jgi:hypothetical protein
LSFLIRSVHLASVSYLVGASVLLILVLLVAQREGLLTSRSLLEVLRAYEWGFWAALGAAAMTGIGNLGALGDSLPPPNTEWGRELTLKLGLVVVFLTISLVRTVSLTLIGPPGAVPESLATVRRLYAATAITGASIMAVAVALAHF